MYHIYCFYVMVAVVMQNPAVNEYVNMSMNEIVADNYQTQKSNEETDRSRTCAASPLDDKDGHLIYHKGDVLHSRCITLYYLVINCILSFLNHSVLNIKLQRDIQMVRCFSSSVQVLFSKEMIRVKVVAHQKYSIYVIKSLLSAHCRIPT